MGIDLDIGEEGGIEKASINSNRLLSNRTLISAAMSTVPGSDKLALSVTSQRSMFRGSVRGMWSVGMGSDLGLHYGLLSFTGRPACGGGSSAHDASKPPPPSAAAPSPTQYTAKLSLGIDRYPLRVGVKHDFSPDHSGRASCGIGPSGGTDISVTSTRSLSSYARITVGLRHAAGRGLTWILRLKRGDLSLSVPILVSGPAEITAGYPFKTIYLGLLCFLVDEVVGEAFVGSLRRGPSSSSSWWGGPVGEREEELRGEEDSLLSDRNKARGDAGRQAALMAGPAREKRRIESSLPGGGGLVVIGATYRAEGGDALDAADQLQFWVYRSTLRLPSASKASMLGFYDVRPPLSTARQRRRGAASPPSDLDLLRSRLGGWWSGLFSYGGAAAAGDGIIVPTLTVRYSYRGGVYETSIADDDELVLPCPGALRIGDSDVVS